MDENFLFFSSSYFLFHEVKFIAIKKVFSFSGNQGCFKFFDFMSVLIDRVA